MLVEAHGPVGDHLAFGIGIQLGQLAQLRLGHAGDLVRLVHRVFGDKGLVFLETHRLGASGIALGLAVRAGIAIVGGGLFAWVVRAQTVADIGIAATEDRMLGDKRLVHRAVLDDVVGDKIEDGQIRLRLEDDRQIRQLEAAVFEGRQHRHLDMGAGQTPVGQARPQHRMHLRHIRPPQHEGIGVFQVVIHPHRLVHAEGAHETNHRRCHAVAGIGVDIIGAQPGLDELGRGIALPHRPLSGGEDPHPVRPLFL